MSIKRILILEDEMVIARDMQSIIRQHIECQIEITNSSSEFLELFPEYLPHLLLCDINLEEPHYNGFLLTEKMRKNFQFGLVFVTAHADKKYLAKAGLLNPIGYILKPFDEKQVAAAVEVALSSIDQYAGTRKNTDLLDILSEREYKILQLISQGKTSSQLAEELFISPKTVENHRHNILKKLGLESKNNSLQSWALTNKQLIE